MTTLITTHPRMGKKLIGWRIEKFVRMGRCICGDFHVRAVAHNQTKTVYVSVLGSEDWMTGRVVNSFYTTPGEAKGYPQGTEFWSVPYGPTVPLIGKGWKIKEITQEKMRDLWN